MTGFALLCPGQGGQHPAMLDMALATGAGEGSLHRAADALGYDLVGRVREGGPTLYRNAEAQPILCAAQLATWAALRDDVPPPQVVAGYSLGELAAYGVVGALPVEATVTLARRRAALMDSARRTPSGLVAVRGIPVAFAWAMAAESGADLAIFNGPDHAVFGGEVATLEAFEKRVTAAGASTVQRLAIQIASHTGLLASAVAPFAAELERSTIGDPPIPVLAGVDASLVRTRRMAIEVLSWQLARRIEWWRCLVAASEMGCRTFLELGPGNALARMAQETIPGARARSVSEFRSLRGIADWVAAALRG